jgi:hypothetical protein
MSIKSNFFFIEIAENYFILQALFLSKTIWQKMCSQDKMTGTELAFQL